MRVIRNVAFFIFLLSCFFVGKEAVIASSSGEMVYLYNAPESELDVRYQYHWAILKTALERTSSRYGPFVMKAAVIMNEMRQANELMESTGTLTVMYQDDKPGFSKKLQAIYIPVDLNLIGYRIFLINKDRQKEFAAVKSAQDLKKFSFGFELGWIDADIMRSNGFTVVNASSYEGLFKMLSNRRFDVFSRAASEICYEYDYRKKSMPDLYIEDTLCLEIPQPMYFWFSANPEGRRLAKRAEEGMRMMLSDGSYRQIFDRYFRKDIERLHLSSRKIIYLKNPFLSPQTPLSDKRLWFNPKAY